MTTGARVLGTLAAVATIVGTILAAVKFFSPTSSVDTEGRPFVQPRQSTKADDFVIGGMRVSCNIRVSSQPRFGRFKEDIPDSSSGSRVAAASVVEMFLRNAALSKGQSGNEYECVFDDDQYYVEITPLGPKPPTLSESCRPYRITSSSSITGGRRVTLERVACSAGNGSWEDRT